MSTAYSIKAIIMRNMPNTPRASPIKYNQSAILSIILLSFPPSPHYSLYSLNKRHAHTAPTTTRKSSAKDAVSSANCSTVIHLSFQFPSYRGFPSVIDKRHNPSHQAFRFLGKRILCTEFFCNNS